MYVFYNFYKGVLNSIWCMVRTEWLFLIFFLDLFCFVSFYKQCLIARSNNPQDPKSIVLNTFLCHKWIVFTCT